MKKTTGVKSNHYNDTFRAETDGPERIRTAVADARFLLEHASREMLNAAMGPRNVDALFEYLDCILLNVPRTEGQRS